MKEKIILIIGILLIVLIVIAILKICKKFRENVYSLFIQAEKHIKSGYKMDYVIEQLYGYMPFPLNIMPQSFYRYLVQKMFNVVKDFLNDGKFNNNGDLDEDNE